MKTFIPNIKVVNELTKYIRPSDIEKARFKKFNTPIINDGNIACDEFFRTEELFNRKKDVVVPFTPYSIDDVPVVDRTSPLARDIRELQGSNSSYVETDLPYYVDIIGENKRIYLESYGIKGVKYPHQADFDASCIWIKDYLYQNCSVDDVANIRYFANKLAPNDPQGIEWEALELLHAGYPIEGIINIMKEAALKKSDGQTQSSRSFVKFIAKYPNFRRYMVTYNNDKSEVFDVYGAKMFPELLEKCGGDEKLAYRILWDCRIEMPDGSFMTEPELLLIGESLFKKDNSWTPVKAEIMRRLENRNCNSYKSYVKKINILLSEDTPFNTILEKISPKKNKFSNARTPENIDIIT